jgi:glucose-1-phosphate thymidylyltransferase
MKGIVLAGGSGTRLHPLTLGVTKQLLPVYNKPMIYYPLSVLLLAGIREILIISTPEDLPMFHRLLGNGSQFGVHFTYAIQESPNGIAEAFIIGKKFIEADPVCLILGDNIFYGHQLGQLLQKAREKGEGASLFGYQVKDPERYGVIEQDENGKILSIEEKPLYPSSNTAVTGLYFYDQQVIEIAESLKPSARGELEITDINQEYLKKNQLSVHTMGRGYTWLDAGTYESLMQASQFVQVIEERQGYYIASLEEIAYNQKFISRAQLRKLGEKMGKSLYGRYLMNVADRENIYANC